MGGYLAFPVPFLSTDYLIVTYLEKFGGSLVIVAAATYTATTVVAVKLRMRHALNKLVAMNA